MNYSVDGIRHKWAEKSLTEELYHCPSPSHFTHINMLIQPKFIAMEILLFLLGILLFQKYF
jgi:hypothetical protein